MARAATRHRGGRPVGPGVRPRDPGHRRRRGLGERRAPTAPTSPPSSRPRRSSSPTGRRPGSPAGGARPAYRDSRLKHRGRRGSPREIVLGADLPPRARRPGRRSAARLDEIRRWRQAHQPLGIPSAGQRLPQPGRRTSAGRAHRRLRPQGLPDRRRRRVRASTPTASSTTGRDRRRRPPPGRARAGRRSERATASASPSRSCSSATGPAGPRRRERIDRQRRAARWPARATARRRRLRRAVGRARRLDRVRDRDRRRAGRARAIPSSLASSTSAGAWWRLPAGHRRDGRPPAAYDDPAALGATGPFAAGEAVDRLAGAGPPPVVFIALHGPFGEDGTSRPSSRRPASPTRAPAWRRRRSAWTRRCSSGSRAGRPARSSTGSRSGRPLGGGPGRRPRRARGVRGRRRRTGA